MTVIKHPLPPLLTSICAQLRAQKSVLGEQAASAILALWTDNVVLSSGMLEVEEKLQSTVDKSCEISQYSQFRSV